LARCCPNSEQYPWCVILMKKSKISKGNLTSIEDQGFRAMVIKVQWNKPPGYCSSYVSDTSTSAVSKTCVSSQNCLEKYIVNILFFVSFGPKYIDNILLKEDLFRNKGLVNTRIQLQQNYPAIRWRNHSPANVFSVNIPYP